MSDQETLNNLNEAKAALHKLMTGHSVVSVWYNGRRTEFRPTNRAELSTYIRELESKIKPTSVRRAYGVTF
ncbi:MAG: phage head-tail joining protein [Rickettsiales bacterium]